MYCDCHWTVDEDEEEQVLPPKPYNTRSTSRLNESKVMASAV